MANNNGNGGNNDTVQQYVDRLKADLVKAEQDFTTASVEEQQQQSKLTKSKQWVALLKKMLDLIDQTNRLGLSYTGTLQRTRKQGEKVGGNAALGVEAIGLLICEIKKVTDCTEVLKNLLKQLTDRIDCKIPQKNPKESIMSVIGMLKEAVDDALNSVKDAVNALLKALQSEEDLWASLAGEKGLVYQLTGMSQHMLLGKKPDLEDCASCNPKKTPVFPMDDEACDFYTSTEKEYNKENAAIPVLQEKLDKATCRREIAQSHKDALAAAYAAAMAAKACDAGVKK